MKRLTSSRLIWPILALAVIMLFNAIFTPGFFRIEMKEGHLFGSLIDIFNRGAPLMLLAIGMTLVIATKGVDLSVGPVAAIAGATAAALIGNASGATDTPLWLVILAAIGVAMLCGAWNGLLVAFADIQPIVATLILMVAGRGVAQLITQGQILTIYYKPYYFIGAGHLFGLPFPLYIVGAVALLAWLLTRRTAFGLFIESIGINARSSFFSGINSRNVKFMVYVISGFCAGVAGLIISSNIRSADGNNAGLYFELDAILAVVIGGTALSGGRFFLAGSILGALIIQSLTTTIYATGVPPEVTLVVKSIVVLTVALLQSPEFRRIVFGPFARRKDAAPTDAAPTEATS
jgi:simple sugar transport system permease protein